MSLNFDKTDLIEGSLVIYDDNDLPTFIPEKDATKEQLAMFTEFRARYAEGKPKPAVEPQEPIPTREEVLEKQLLDTQAALADLQESIILLKINGGM
jgi:hypothetical protein